MDDHEFNEDILDLVTQMSLAEHLEWDADRLDVMRDIIVTFGTQVQDQYQQWVEGAPNAQPGSIHSMSSHSSRDSSNHLNKEATLADMGRTKDYIQQLRTKLLWYQRSIVREISMSGSSGSSLLDHVSAMIGLIIA
jgi:hypothetical protein